MMRLRLLATLALLFLLGACSGDADLRLRLKAEQDTVRAILTQRETVPEVEIWKTNDGRLIRCTFTGEGADSLAAMDTSSPPPVAKRRAVALARTLKRSYGDFEKVYRFEVRFATRTGVDEVRVGKSANVMLEKEDLREIDG